MTKQKPKNIELVMSVGGIRELVGWLEAHRDHIGSDSTMEDYIGFLKQVLEKKADYC